MPEPGGNNRRVWIAATLLLCGAALRLEYLREFAASPLFHLAIGADIYEYDRRAREIITGIWTPADPDIHAPLYSWLLAGIYGIWGPILAVARGVQTLLNFAAWGIFYIDWRKRAEAGSRMPEWVLALGMLAPAMWFFPAEIVSESLLIPLLLAATAMLAREARRWKIAGGVCAGLAAVTHPMALFFILAETLFHLCKRPQNHGAAPPSPKPSRKPQILTALLIATSALLPILPVSILRSVEAGHPVLIQSNSAFNLYLGHNPEADGSCYIRPGVRWREIHRQAAATGDQEGYFRTRMLEFAVRHPIREMGLAGRKLLLLALPEELPAGADTPGIYRWTGLMAYAALPLTCMIFLLAFAGGETLWRRRREPWDPTATHLLILGAAMAAAQMVTVTSGRYRLAMLPGVFCLAAIALEYVRCGKKPLPWRGAATGIIVMSAAYAAAPPRPESEMEAASLLGEAWFRRGDMARAEEMLMKSFTRDPDRDANLLGEIARRRGDVKLAEQYFRYAAANAPQEASGVMNLGMLAAETGRHKEALGYFREAVRRNESDAESRYSLALALERDGKKAEAEREYRMCLRLEPAHRRALNNLGILRFGQKDFQEAERCFSAALRLEPENAGLRRNYETVRRILRDISTGNRN